MPALAQPTAELWNTIFNAALILGAIIILAGTWGANWTGSMKEFYANSRISANEATTAAANAEASRANAAAATANERASALEKDAAEARLKQEQLRASNLALESSIEAERRARQELQAAVSSRSLSPEQRAALVSASDGPPGEQINMTLIGDSEASSFGMQIAESLRSAGFEINLSRTGMIVPPIYGVLVRAPADSRIVKALNAANVNFEHIHTMDGQVMIIVGLKEPAL